MAEVENHVINCKACISEGDLKLPGDTLLLRWLACFLRYHNKHNEQLHSSPQFTFNYITSQAACSTSCYWTEVARAEPNENVSVDSFNNSMPEECSIVELPCAKCGIVTRSSITTLLTWMVFTYHHQFPDYGYNHLLGYKETCFKACAEVSPWTQFVTSHLLPVLDSQGGPRLILETLNHLESKLRGKQHAAVYKRNYFKTENRNSIKCYYYKLHIREKKDVYLTSHLPNLVDILSYVTLCHIMKRCGPEVIARFPYLSTWHKVMEQFPGVSQSNTECNITHSGAVEELSTQLSSLSLTKEQPVTSPSSNHPNHPELSDKEILQKLQKELVHRPLHKQVEQLGWDQLPHELDPSRGGKLPLKRAVKKRQQLENMYSHVKSCLQCAAEKETPQVVVDFCAGGGHVGLLVAYLHPDVEVHLVENKEESLSNASHRISSLGLSNVKLFQCNLTQYHGVFHVGVSLHACGVATDLVLDQCVRSKASAVVSPCCYGTITSTTSLQLPRSKELSLVVSKQEMVTVRHSSDKTELGIDQQTIGVDCMLLSDIDRKYYMYGCRGNKRTNIYKMEPSDCSPKNHIIVSCVERAVG